MAEHNIGEKEIMLYDRIALERHDHTATRAERLQNAKHWVLRLNAHGPLQSLVILGTWTRKDMVQDLF